jgi:predicted phosphodiesterase
VVYTSLLTTGFGPASTVRGALPLKAIISDIHSNLEALQAVLADIKSQGISEVYCLGDVVGYGPNPRECIDLVMESKLVLLGNHDQGAMFDPDGFNQSAEKAIFWTRQQLESSSEPRQLREKRWEFLAERPRSHRENGYLFVHGSARNPLNEYVFPEDVYNQRKMERIFALVDKYCFQGHTHVPGIFTENMQFLSPEDTVQRRLSRPAARRQLASLLHHHRQRHHQLPPRRVRRGNHHQEDLRHAGPGKLPRRPLA